MATEPTLPELSDDVVQGRRSWWTWLIPVICTLLTYVLSNLFKADPCKDKVQENLYLLRKIDSTNRDIALYMRQVSVIQYEDQKIRLKNDSLQNIIKIKYLPPARLILKHDGSIRKK